jgi:hypothetical protein
LVAKSDEFPEAGRTVNDVIQALVAQLYGTVISR